MGDHISYYGVLRISKVLLNHWSRCPLILEGLLEDNKIIGIYYNDPVKNTYIKNLMIVKCLKYFFIHQKYIYVISFQSLPFSSI